MITTNDKGNSKQPHHKGLIANKNATLLTV